jgi:hypothetical protein
MTTAATIALALEVTEGLAAHVEQHAGAELRITCMRGRQLTHLHTVVDEGELYRPDGHTITMPEGGNRWTIDGMALEAPGYTLRTWPHPPIVLREGTPDREPDAVTYRFSLEVAP